MSKNIEINIQTTANTYETLYPKTLGSLVDGAVSLATNATNATNATSASQATKLSTARTIRTNLSSTSTASFDGTSNITPGIYGTLSVSYGGTGVTSYSNLANQLSNYFNNTKYELSIVEYKKSNNSSNKITFPPINGKTPKFYYFPSASHPGPTTAYVSGQGMKTIPTSIYVTFPILTSVVSEEGEYFLTSYFNTLRIWTASGTNYNTSGTTFSITKGMVEISSSSTVIMYENNGYTVYFSSDYFDTLEGSTNTAITSVSIAFCA